MIATRTKEQSSLIAQIGWDINTSILLVTFHSGNEYHYNEVPQDTAIAFISAESWGKYYNQHIKNKFSHEQIQHPFFLQ